MSDLISRQGTINMLKTVASCVDEDTQMFVDTLIRSVSDLPPAQPKIGKWIAVDSFTAFGGDEATWEAHGNPVAYYYCSVCKKQSRVDEFGEDILSNYCPDCGAKMEGET